MRSACSVRGTHKERPPPLSSVVVVCQRGAGGTKGGSGGTEGAARRTLSPSRLDENGRFAIVAVYDLLRRVTELGLLQWRRREQPARGTSQWMRECGHACGVLCLCVCGAVGSLVGWRVVSAAAAAVLPLTAVQQMWSGAIH